MYRILHILTGEYVTVYTVPKQLCQSSDKNFIFIHPRYRLIFADASIAEIKSKKEAERVIQKVINQAGSVLPSVREEFEIIKVK